MTVPVQLLWSREELEKACKGTVNPVLISDDEYEITTLCKYKLRVKESDLSLGRNLMHDGFWEMWVTQFFANAAAGSKVIIDVGANVGYYTMLFADIVGPKGRVIAIEPQKELVRMIQDGLVANQFYNVDIYEVMAMDKISSCDLYIDPDFLGDASYLPSATSSYHVLSATIDELVKGPVDFVKIDVEGAEQKVIRGMKRTIRENPDIGIAMEWVPERIDDPSSFLAELREEYNFDIYEISSSNHLAILTDKQLLGVKWDMLYLKGKI